MLDCLQGAESGGDGLSDGDEVVFESPNYMQLHGIPPGFGATIKPFSLRPGADWEPDWDAFERALSGKTRLVYVTNPNNPTGTRVDSASLRAFIEVVPAHVIIVVDEAYFEYVRADDHPDRGRRRRAARAGEWSGRLFRRWIGLAIHATILCAAAAGDALDTRDSPRKKLSTTMAPICRRSRSIAGSGSVIRVLSSELVIVTKRSSFVTFPRARA